MHRVLRRALTVAVALLFGVVAVALAGFSANVSAGATYAAGTLSPPSDLSAVAGPCTIAVSASIRLNWTASPSTWASGYEVLQATVSGGPYTAVATVSGVDTTTYLDGSLPFLTTYYYVVRATKGNWRSVTTAQAGRTTPTLTCL